MADTLARRGVSYAAGRKTDANVSDGERRERRGDGLSGHSTLISANLITLAHFSVSSAINFPKSAGAIGIGTLPKFASRAFNAGSPSAVLISELSLSTISEG